jgi:hypothetical protein
VLKNGTLVDERPLQGQPCFTFGRSPTADVLLEHPSASRLHAGETVDSLLPFACDLLSLETMFGSHSTADVLMQHPSAH